jgi:hypothetical protein
MMSTRLDDADHRRAKDALIKVLTAFNWHRAATRQRRKERLVAAQGA